MAGRIPQSFIDELLTRVDVVDVVDSRIKLKKAGKNYSACCPFHNENTPSFTVSRDKQFYYCFGCGASGSALKFVMEFDGLAFPDAVEKLADSVSMSVPKEHNPAAEREQREHKPLYELLQQSADFYARMLRQHSDRERAVNYLKQRGLSGQAARFFNIGFAPAGWDNLQSTLAHDDTLKKQLIANGMLIERDDGRTYDRFRDRIMFPIRDIKGRTIAFGGRVLGDEKPKYLNSPETPLFQKNRELYGLYEARKIRQKLTRLIIVEGYMDVVALAQYGIHYAVATLGTSTSEHHLHRLYRMVPEVIFCFDGDQAGKNAAARAMETVLPVLEDGRQARFLFLPDGEDPDSLVQQEGKAAFEQRLASASHLPEFLFEHLKQQVDFDSLDGKARLDQLAAPLISRIPQGTLKDLMVAELENQIGITSRAMEKLANEPPARQNPHSPTHSRTASAARASGVRASGAHPSSPRAANAPTNTQSHDEPPAFHDTPPDWNATDISAEYSDTEALSASMPSNADTASTGASGTDLPTSRVLSALTALVRAPQLLDAIAPDTLANLPTAQTDQERLLLEAIRKLQSSPQTTSIGLLIQWIGSPYHQELTELANQPTTVEPVAADIQDTLQRMELRQYDDEYNQLKGMLSNPEQRKKMTEQQRQRLNELTRLVRGKRARAAIYRRDKPLY